MERLTDERFWDDYWAGVEIPSRVDMSLPFERALSGFLAQTLKGETGTVLEVGCAPGKWLAYAAEISALSPAGIEYSTAGLAATKRNFDAHGVEPEALIEGDFFAIEPEPRYDVVMSLGFIEHFDEPCSVVKRHVEWLKPGGLLVLGVPNFRGVHGALQRTLGLVTYAAHNLDVMDPAWFQRCASELDLDSVALEWMAGFEPSLPIVEVHGRDPRVLFARGVLGIGRRVRRSPLLDRLNGPKVSAYLAFVGRKSGDAS